MVARGMMGKGYVIREFGMDMYTLLYLKGSTVQHMGLWSMLYGSLDGRQVWGRLGTYVMWLNPFALP